MKRKDFIDRKSFLYGGSKNFINFAVRLIDDATLRFIHAFSTRNPITCGGLKIESLKLRK